MKLKITILSLLLAVSIIVLVVVKRAEAAADWVTIDSSHLMAGGVGVAFCHAGEDGHLLTEALDGDDYWVHALGHTHWFIIDLGQEYNVQKVRGRSDTPYDPDDVDIYVSNDIESWGAAVASGADFSNTASPDWVEVDTTDKNGRYVAVDIVDAESIGNLYYGGLIAAFTIFDVYGEATAAPAAAGQVIIVNMD